MVFVVCGRNTKRGRKDTAMPLASRSQRLHHNSVIARESGNPVPQINVLAAPAQLSRDLCLLVTFSSYPSNRGLYARRVHGTGC
jgi:hypothetical protein